MECRCPSILVPYQGPSTEENEHDIFLYLRPQSNGIQVESIILKEIEKDSEYRKGFHLVYLANLPGDFLRKKHVIERHYALRIHFAIHGAGAFTPFMKKQFSHFAQEDFSSCRIMGSFEALKELNMSPRQLFDIWVGEANVFSLMGQSIKRYQDSAIGTCYIINYDVPMLLHMNHRDTNIAAMMFRTSCGYSHFSDLIQRMKKQLLQAGIITAKQRISRVLHFSRGPFEEILDARGHLYDTEGAHIPLEEYSFVRYLMAHGVSLQVARGFVDHPIITCHGEEERNLFEYTISLDYEGTFKKMQDVIATSTLPSYPICTP